MDLQIEKETLQEYSTKVKTNASALLWVIGTTVAAFILYAVVVVVAESFPSPDEQTSHSMRSDIAFYGGMLIPIFLPAGNTSALEKNPSWQNCDNRLDCALLNFADH